MARNFLLRLVCIGVVVFCCCSVRCGEEELRHIRDRELQRQQEQERQRRKEQGDATPDVRLQPQVSETGSLEYPENEFPCFEIREIRLAGNYAEKFHWALRPVSDAIGRCLGAKGINMVMRRVQNIIVEKGYITTRIVAAPQDLQTGILVLTLIPGTVENINLSDDSSNYFLLQPSMPLRQGQILNLRQVEQGLENLRRVPSAKADIQLVPGEKEGESGVVVQRKQMRPIRFSLGMDDSGSRDTGKYQGNATLSIDNPLGLSDMLYASISRDVEGKHRYGTRGYGFHYSVPFGFWQLSANTNSYDYHQTVAGNVVDYEYSGESRNTNIELSRVVFRSGKAKTSVSFGGWLTTSNNYIDDTELEIQRRRMAGWEIGLTHRHYLGQATVDAGVRFKKGTGAFNSVPAPEEELDEGTSRPEILSFNLRVTAPFKLAGQNFRYIGSFRNQWAFTKLISRDRISIGGRYSVRGYDGEYTLAADNGFVYRNEIGWIIPAVNQELYGAVDIGRVWGSYAEHLLGQSLSGAALGLRGGYKNFNYDVFISGPINKPTGFQGSRWVGGFNVSMQF